MSSFARDSELSESGESGSDLLWSTRSSGRPLVRLHARCIGSNASGVGVLARGDRALLRRDSGCAQSICSCAGVPSLPGLKSFPRPTKGFEACACLLEEAHSLGAELLCLEQFSLRLRVLLPRILACDVRGAPQLATNHLDELLVLDGRKCSTRDRRGGSDGK
jgi:hypothetical protein